MAKKPVPRILRESIVSDFYRLRLAELLDATVDPVEKQAAIDAEEKQLKERLRAVYEYFDIDPATADAKDQLILALCKEKFPQAFSAKEENKRGRKVKWGSRQQLALVVAVKAFKRHGKKRKKQAYSLLAKQLGMSANSIKTRHSEALKKVRRKYDDAALDRLIDNFWKRKRYGN